MTVRLLQMKLRMTLVVKKVVQASLMLNSLAWILMLFKKVISLVLLGLGKMVEVTP